MHFWGRHISGFFKSWLVREDGVAAVEYALVFPMMLVLMLGVFDLGYGMLAAQKTIRASQVTGDLIARNKSVDETDIQEAIDAGEVALTPFDTSRYDYRILSIEFTDDSGAYDVLWERSSSGSSFDDAFANSLSAIAEEGEGLVIVQVRYRYVPIFADVVMSEMTFGEIAFLRGRLSRTVPMGDS